MDEPTDRAIRIQGLKRSEYDSLDHEGKTVIASRARRLTELADITLAAELLFTLAESDESSRGYITEALEGKHPRFNEGVRQLIDEYLDTDVKTSIRDYYRIKFAGKKGIIAASLEREAINEDLRGVDAEAPNEEQAVVEAASAPMIEPQKTATEPVKSHEPQAAPPKAGASDSRRHDIAAILSRWEKRDLDSVMKTEADVIGQIMTVTDENGPGAITDERVCKAVEAMIANQTNGVQYYREALLPANRDILILTAKNFV